MWEYTELSAKNCIGVYLQIKALGEVYCGKNLTLRTSIIGPFDDYKTDKSLIRTKNDFDSRKV